MKLLVLAQIPPPLHGQSLMVRTMVEGLPGHGIAVHHVPLNLSRDHADIGRWRVGKIFTVLAACLHTLAARFRHDCDTLYYVPAPAKRGALYRDWVVMLLCRPFYKKLVLHWHAAGLGAWLLNDAAALERWITGLLLGRADLSMVLGETLRHDAEVLHSRKTVVIRNGIADPCEGFTRPPTQPGQTRTAFFIGLLVPEKGVLDAIEAVRLANAATPPGQWRLILAGDIPDPVFADQINRLVRDNGGWLHHAGFVRGADKHQLFATANVLVFPTYYAAETQGLVVTEALAYDLPVIVTRWRAVADNLPAGYAYLVPPRAPEQIAQALAAVAQAAPPAGAVRRHFLTHCTIDRHLAAVADALRQLDGS